MIFFYIFYVSLLQSSFVIYNCTYKGVETMIAQSQLLTCKICGKTGMEKIGFHVRKKHMMNMAEYQNWEPEKADKPEKQTLDVPEEPVQQTLEIAEELRKQPWYKKFFFCLNKLIC